MSTEADIVQSLAEIEDYNNQFRQPNPDGRFPLCKPRIADPERRCERGEYAAQFDVACPTVPRDQRWGEAPSVRQQVRALRREQQRENSHG